MYLFRIVFLQCLYCFILCISKSLFKNFFLKKYSLSTLSKTVFQKQTSKSKYLISLSILRLLHFFGKIYYFQKLHTQRECPKSLIQKFFSTELSWWPSINMKTIKSKEFYVYIWYCRPEGRNMAQKHCTAEGNKVELVNFWKT